MNASTSTLARRAAFPAIFSGAVLAAAVLLRRRALVIDGLPPAIIATLAVMFIGLCYSYVTFHKQGMSAAAWACALMADGIAILGAVFGIGAPAPFGWIGAGAAMLGVGIAATHMAPKPKKQFAAKFNDLLPETCGKREIRAVVSSIVVPAAFLQTDEEGVERLVAANDPFAAILGRVASTLGGLKFADLIPPDVEAHAMKFADAEWVSHRTTRGRQTMFLLTPTVQAKQDEPEDATPFGDTSIIDGATGLFTEYYMKYKGESDVQLCRRSKRNLSAVMFEMRFGEHGAIVPHDDARKKAFTMFASMVRMSVRACDSAFLFGEETVAVLLPDTSQQGARVVVTRMMDNAKKLAKMEVPEIASSTIRESTLSFFGDELSSFANIIKELEAAKSRRI